MRDQPLVSDRSQFTRSRTFWMRMQPDESADILAEQVLVRRVACRRRAHLEIDVDRAERVVIARVLPNL
jgi:hypothetical protein